MYNIALKKVYKYKYTRFYAIDQVKILNNFFLDNLFEYCLYFSFFKDELGYIFRLVKNYIPQIRDLFINKSLIKNYFKKFKTKKKRKVLNYNF